LLGLVGKSLMLKLIHSFCLINQHYWNAIKNFVSHLQTRIIKTLFILVIDQTSFIFWTCQNLKQAGVQRRFTDTHGLDNNTYGTHAVININNSATCSSHSSRVAASRFNRNNGSVFEDRTLNHHEPQSTVRPSR